ncbi:hypothetical protein GCM10009856_05770 [Mycolicibacterium llatzerense]
MRWPNEDVYVVPDTTCLRARFARSGMLRRIGFRLRKKEVNLQLADKESKEASYQDDFPFVLFEGWPQ